MSKIPDLKRIVKEDFPQQYYDLIDKLAFPLNSHMEQVRNLFNSNIGIDNLTQEIITLTFQTNNASVPIAPISFKTTLAAKIKGIIVISATVTNKVNTYLTAAPFVSFTQNDKIVTINAMAGLGSELQYQMSLLLIS